jgi:serine/threonine-protein phosphatase 6 catalytic subunit
MSPRGAGWLFGENETDEFEELNNLGLIVRAH